MVLWTINIIQMIFKYGERCSPGNYWNSHWQVLWFYLRTNNYSMGSIIVLKGVRARGQAIFREVSLPWTPYPYIAQSSLLSPPRDP